jgi:glyoxylase-like metal-dependent hydrolase (beta-lactamase superfamily II)
MKRHAQFEFGPITVHRLVTGPIEENAYIVLGADAHGVIVDPGDDAGDILALVREHGAKPEAILLTHAHFDHVGAVEAVRRALEIPVWLHTEAGAQYAQAGLSAARWNLPFVQPSPPDHTLEIGSLEIAGIAFDVLPTPGHAPGHVSLYSSHGFVLSGDALFKGSIGRTDLPGSDHALLISSIREHLLTLPPQTVVLSGHGPETTIGAEANSNPYLS